MRKKENKWRRKEEEREKVFSILPTGGLERRLVRQFLQAQFHWKLLGVEPRCREMLGTIEEKGEGREREKSEVKGR